MPDLHREPVRLVALAAREAGLAALRGLVCNDRRIRVVALYTHRRLPRSEDPSRGGRPEFPSYVTLANELGVPLHMVDTRAEAARLEGLEACCPFDILLSVSWRYRVPAHVLAWARLGAINLHRGRLPDYAGAEPVRRALEAGESSVTLTAHVMTEEIDAGPVLVEHTHPVGPRRGPTLADEVERIKREMLPLYPGVALEAVEKCVLSKGGTVQFRPGVPGRSRAVGEPRNSGRGLPSLPVSRPSGAASCRLTCRQEAAPLDRATLR